MCGDLSCRTTTKSKRFHHSRKYTVGPKENSFATASAVKMATNSTLHTYRKSSQLPWGDGMAYTAHAESSQIDKTKPQAGAHMPGLETAKACSESIER
jgi:hypothetical protein